MCMNSKESKHGKMELSSLSETEDADLLSPELKQLLLDAYPMPEGRIAASVMNRIHAEQKRKRRNLFLRYGSMAACLVLLCGVLVLVFPQMERMMVADTAMNEAAPRMVDTSAVTETMAVEAYSDSVPVEEEVEDEVAESVEAGESGVRLYSMARPEKQSSGTGTEAEAETETSVQEYGTTKTEVAYAMSLLKSVSMTAEAMNTDAAEDTDTADGFLTWLIEEGYLTSEAYATWAKTQSDAWTVDDLCEAFTIDPTLYDAWVRK